jgi:ribosomal protein S18 acetylase RimI-like enzyme
VISAAAAKENALFVAEEGHEWIGLVGGWVFEEAGSQVPYLISMWVDPRYRGRGMDHLIVEVEATNRNAISLYTRCGFRPTGEVRPHPTYPGLQEVMMKLALDHE